MSIENPNNFEPEAETATEKPMSISEQIKIKEKQVEDLSKLAGTDFWVSADGSLILSWNKEIEDLKNQLEQEQEKINAEFSILFDKILAMPEIKGSVKTFSPKTVVDSIQEIIKINTDPRYDKFDFVVGINRITRTEGVREEVEKLILKRRGL
jgi:hypothetical protein